MASLNKVMLIGNLTRDPEVRYTPKGTAVADIGVAVNRQFTAGEGGERQEETTFVDVTLWGRTAELAQQYLSKGRPVFVEGRLQMDQWQDKQTGQNRSKLKVVAENLQFLGAPRGGEGGGSQRYAEQEPDFHSAASPPPQSSSAASTDGEDDIPF